jgi:hypothetical protein
MGWEHSLWGPQYRNGRCDVVTVDRPAFMLTIDRVGSNGWIDVKSREFWPGIQVAPSENLS